MTTSGAWLAERLAAAPPSLRERVLAALADGPVPETDMGRALHVTAERLMRRAQSGPPTHETGLTLLAADALVTLACEWEAESRATSDEKGGT